MQALDFVRSVVHASVCFSAGGKVLYVDPYHIAGEPKDANFVIITHSHDDHYSKKDLAKVCNPDTRIFTAQAVMKKMEKEDSPFLLQTETVAAEEGILPLDEEISFTPVPAQNRNHPAGFGFGVLLGFYGFTYYLSGDTDFLFDFGCDVLFCVCDGIYNMPNYEKAVPAALLAMRHRPKIVIPYHYGDFPGTSQNGALLKQALEQAGFAATLRINKQ